MARPKKNKIFDLFKKDFKITLFYKPSLATGDEFYYIVLDNAVRLKIKVIREVIVIDDVVPLTATYIAPIYQKIVDVLMKQENFTILISLLGNTSVIQNTCVKSGAPLVSDERYITVPKAYYDKVKQSSEDESSYGFYILAVTDDMNNDVEPTSMDHSKPVKKHHDIGTVSDLSKVVSYLEANIEDVTIENVSGNIARIILTESDKFTIEIVDNIISIKDFMSEHGSSLNFIQIVNMINILEGLVNILPDVYISNVMNTDVYRLCMAKKYELISEQQKIPNNKLFKQVFHGFGTFKVTLINN